MATQYTPILQLALPVTGELNGTWGDVFNNNITSMVEQAIAGMATVSTWTANSHTLTTANGTTDEARCAMLLLQTGAGGTALTAIGEVICPARTKLYVVKNDAAYAVTVKTSAGTGISVSAGDTTFVFCDGTNVVACVTQITNGHITGNLTVDGNTTLGDSSADTVVINAGSTTLNDGGAIRFEDNAGGEYVALKAPATIAASFTLTLPIDDGASGQALITDGSGNLSWSTAASGDVYGPASATNTAVALFDGTTGKLLKNSVVTIDGSGNVSGLGTVNATTLDLTNLEVNNIKAKDGTASITLADSTGVASFTAAPVLNSGTANQIQYLNGSKQLVGDADLTFDGTTLSATNITSSGSVTLSGGTANGVAYLNGSKVLTTGSALTFDGTNLGIGTSSPNTKLEVAKAGLTSATGTTFGAVSIKDTSGVINRFATIDFSASVVGDAPIVRISSETASSGSFLRFGTCNNYGLGVTNTALTIDPSGNLGLGVTPSAWFFASKVFENESGSLSSYGTGQQHLAQNAYLNTSSVWTYKNSATAVRYEQSSGTHSWYTAPSGTAGNAISFTQAMTLDASGNLGIGTSSPAALLNVKSSNTGTAYNIGQMLSGSANGSGGQIYLPALVWTDATGDGKYAAIDAYRGSAYGNGGMRFSVYDTSNVAQERMRIDSSGNLLVGTTSAGTNGAGFRLYRPTAGQTGADFVVAGSSATAMLVFVNDNGNVGTITTSGSTTAFNTSSDYRLKEAVAPMTGALAKVQALKPVTYKWKADGSDGEGFIAHELQAVVPDCVTGEKDAVDAEGKPVYQGIDTSFLVATLTKAIQEQQEQINQLKAEVAALKGN